MAPTDRRLSLDSLAPLQAIWSQPGQTSFTHPTSSPHQHMPQSIQDVVPEMQPSFARMNLQDLQAPNYSQLPNHQLNGLHLDGGRFPSLLISVIVCHGYDPISI